MATFVPQREYMTVSSEVNIGSFGAVPCTIMILYNDTSRLVSHLDATTDLETFKFQVLKYLSDKDPADISILFTDSGDPNNLILREKLEKSLKEIGLDNEITLIEDTQVILTSKNKILTKFEPKKMFYLENFDNNLGKKLINQSRKFKKRVDKFAKSRRELNGVDEFGRQKHNIKGNSRLGYTYNYDLGEWVYNPDTFRQNQMVKTKPKSNPSIERLKFEEIRQKSILSFKPLKFEEIRQKSDLYSGLEEIFKEDEKYIGSKLNNTVISKPKPKKKKSYKKPKTFKKKTFNFRFKDTNHRQRGRPTKKMRRKKVTK